MWRAAGYFDVSACLTTHVIFAKLYFLVGGLEHFLFHILGIIAPTDELIFFRGVGIPPSSFCLGACGVMFWRARLPHEFLAWAGGLAGTRAALAHSAINFDVLQICVPVGTVSFPSDLYTLFQGSSGRIKSACTC